MRVNPKKGQDGLFWHIKKGAFDDGGTDCNQNDLSMKRTEADCIMMLLGRFTIYSFHGVLKTVTDNDLSTSESRVFI